MLQKYEERALFRYQIKRKKLNVWIFFRLRFRPIMVPWGTDLKMANFSFKRLFRSAEHSIKCCKNGKYKPSARNVFFRFGDFTLLFQKYWFFYELFVSDSGTNRPVLKWLRLTFWTFNTSDMPLKRKQYNRFAVGQYTKARKSLQEEFAREKASLSQLSKEVKTLQRKVQRLDDKVNKLRMTASVWNEINTTRIRSRYCMISLIYYKGILWNLSVII